jgi:Mrp family chromosome partitioning ATPase
LSRNFDLLQQANRLDEVLEPPAFAADPQRTPEPNLRPAEVTQPSTPAVEVAGPVRQEIARLVANLFLLPGARAPRQVAFAGVEAGGGCSWMCARVSEILASQTKGTVCVVDCNLRSPSLHRQFAVANDLGLSDALLQSNSLGQYVRQLSRRNLWFLSCGSSIDNWQDQVTSETLRFRLTELRSHFDYVLLDVAPIRACNDCMVLGSSSDGVVLVLKANSTRREGAQKALNEFKAANIPVLGAILNQRTFPIPDKIYNWL